MTAVITGCSSSVTRLIAAVLQLANNYSRIKRWATPGSHPWPASTSLTRGAVAAVNAISGVVLVTTTLA
jgi:hypothetical protein